MSKHLSPTEMAQLLGLERRAVIEHCMALGVPIFQGKIDPDLFMACYAADVRAVSWMLLDSSGNLIESYDDADSARRAFAEIVAADPANRGHVALIGYDSSGHPVGTGSSRTSVRNPA